MGKPKAFNIFIDNSDLIDELTTEQAGLVFKALFAHAKDEEYQLDDKVAAIVTMVITKQMDRDREKYDEICEKRSNAGKKGGKAKEANESKCKQLLANESKCKQYEDEDEKEDEDENKKETSKEKAPEQDFDDVANEVISEFNRICLDLPEVAQLTDHRRRLLFNDGMMDKKVEDYSALFKRVHKSDYLCGRSGSWRADFDFVIKNSVKITEGSYYNVKPPDKKNKGGRMFTEAGASFDTGEWKGNVPEGCG